MGRRTTQRNILVYGQIVSTLTSVAERAGFTIPRGRHKGKVNIQKLSRVSGVSNSTLWYLTRRPEEFLSLNVHTLAKLCHALDCQVGDLFKYERVPVGIGMGRKGDSDDFSLDSLSGLK